MTGVRQTTWTAPPRRAGRTGRVVALVLGVLLLLPGLALVTGGGVLLWASALHRSDGFVVSPEERLGSPGHALVSDRIDLRAGADWLPVSAALGRARIEVTPATAEEVFLGIAPAADARAYLDGVGRTTLDALGFDGPADAADEIPGGAPPGAPADQDFWTAQVAGRGPQQLTWEPADGDWVLVVMNADGSAGVDVQGRVGAELPALAGIGCAVLGAGLVVTLLAVLLVRPGLGRTVEDWPTVRAVGRYPAAPPRPLSTTSAPSGEERR
ncbi:hypothetical protein SAMN05660690_0285 [Geodermatophilus telluris]|uniref:Uncharacterized protein n=1 Tax=Geodermatophilus telluris TaxID=1190417 RepID=A0A1G6IAS1_9ACTN|nr:hypothetical protein [Geodermatophilus telluris]SDC03594.1 hypothetical protein SAMN05660690_0285 [Geodermatophilus telluris]